MSKEITSDVIDNNGKIMSKERYFLKIYSIFSKDRNLSDERLHKLKKIIYKYLKRREGF